MIPLFFPKLLILKFCNFLRKLWIFSPFKATVTLFYLLYKNLHESKIGLDSVSTNNKTNKNKNIKHKKLDSKFFRWNIVRWSCLPLLFFLSIEKNKTDKKIGSWYVWNVKLNNQIQLIIKIFYFFAKEKIILTVKNEAFRPFLLKLLKNGAGNDW